MSRETNMVLKANLDILKLVNDENKTLAEEFIEYLEATDKTPSTIKVYKSNLNIINCYLYERCKNKPFVEISKRDILNLQKFMLRAGLSSARIKNVRATISSLSNYIEAMLDDEYPNFRNVVGKIPPPPANRVRQHTVLDMDEIQELLDVLTNKGRHQVACYVAMCAYSGARKSETILYQDAWFNDKAVINGLYKTPLIRTKGRGSAGKQLNKYVIRNKVDFYLENWRKQREELGVNIDDLFVTKELDDKRRWTGKWLPAQVSTANSFIETCNNIMDLKDENGEDKELNLYSHSLRHFYATYLAKANIPTEVIADIIGHGSVEMTKLYIDIDSEDSFMKYFSDEGIVEVERGDLKNI